MNFPYRDDLVICFSKEMHVNSNRKWHNYKVSQRVWLSWKHNRTEKWGLTHRKACRFSFLYLRQHNLLSLRCPSDTWDIIIKPGTHCYFPISLASLTDGHNHTHSFLISRQGSITATGAKGKSSVWMLWYPSYWWPSVMWLHHASECLHSILRQVANSDLWNTLHCDAATKWMPFHRRYFQLHFLEWKWFNSD